MDGREIKLSVNNLKISFRTDGGKVQAVRGINFDLYKGETLALVGESGSGKSVTNRAIIGGGVPPAAGGQNRHDFPGSHVQSQSDYACGQADDGSHTHKGQGRPKGEQGRIQRKAEDAQSMYGSDPRRGCEGRRQKEMSGF